MAAKRWIGNALAVAQVDTLTIGGTLEVGDLLIATINGKNFSHSATSTTLATAATAFAAAWNALSATLYPEFSEITAAATSGGALTLTADTPGRPFTCTVSTTESNGGAADAQTFGTASTTANSGPKVWDTAANWDTGAVPVDGDDVYIDQGGDILYGLAQSAVELASLTILQSYTGKIGLPQTNKDSGNVNGTYPEYRAQYLVIGGTLVTIGGGLGSGSQRIKIDCGSDPSTIRILNTGQSEDQAVGAVIIKGNTSAGELHVSKGSVDYAPYLGETGQLAVINVAYRDNVQADARVNIGAGVTLSNCAIKQSGGTLTLNSATSGTATIVLEEGTLNLEGTAGHLGLTIRGGTCNYNSSGTLGGNPSVSGKGHLDFSRDLRTRAVTNPVEVYGPDAKVSDPHKTVTTLVIDCNETANGANMNIGRNVRITRGTPA